LPPIAVHAGVNCTAARSDASVVMIFFDGGSSSFWSCEQCSSFESVEKCSTDGLPEAGEKDCKACCFGDSGGYAPTYKPTVEPQPTYRPTVQDT